MRREAFLSSHDPEPPLAAGEDGLYRRQEGIVRAKQLDVPFSVEVGHGRGTLAGVEGDWLIEYPDGSFGIVGSSIFDASYTVSG